MTVENYFKQNGLEPLLKEMIKIRDEEIKNIIKDTPCPCEPSGDDDEPKERIDNEDIDNMFEE